MWSAGLGLWAANMHAGTGAKVVRVKGDTGCRVYHLKWRNVVKAKCDITFSQSFISGHLGRGWEQDNLEQARLLTSSRRVFPQLFQVLQTFTCVSINS